MIDEKVLLEAIRKRIRAFGDEILDYVEWLIEEQPKVGEWIPCSERLPNEKEAWAFNEKEGIHEPNEFIVQVKGAELPTVAFFDGESFTHRYADDGYGFGDEIIAWQPLPEPYKGE